MYLHKQVLTLIFKTIFKSKKSDAANKLRYNNIIHIGRVYTKLPVALIQ